MERKDLKKLLPHGYQKVVAQRAGVTQKSVCDFLNGKHNSYKIEKAALQVAVEVAKERKALMSQIQ